MLYKKLFTIVLIVCGFATIMMSPIAVSDDSIQKLIVYKSPTCGCCGNWISHMEANGFTIEAVNQIDILAIKYQHGIEGKLQSCHTAVDATSGYVFEGHVPAGAIKQFLSNPPVGAKGLSVPGMPTGSPGMEMGDRFSAYQIVQINEDQPPSLYMNVRSQSEQAIIGVSQ
jgi:hypothetical protein